MDYREPTIRSRELGEGLRLAMVGAGINGKQMAARLGWSTSKVSRMFVGNRGVTEVDVATFLGVCGVAGAERDRLLDLCRERDARGWLQQHGSRLPKQLRTLIDHEEQAVAISQFEVHLIPGLMQTAEYAREIIRCTVNVPAHEVEDRVEAKLARQRLISASPPPDCVFYIHELALRLEVGGPAVMSAQLHELLRLSVRRYISIRVLQARHGAHAGTAGPFRLMDFAGIKPIVFLESETSCTFLERSEEIAAYRSILVALADTALDEGQSRELIAGLATELYPDQEEHDERV
ncbi:helix-turn-helix transcriptional regulator [Actinokineospora sp. NBRC 105648]|uniref:helix-turn-helix domain-containing protein n=1 Tax=Actinokineospora sp. NBRC 105648 TaxID=3032206 RepID=UPI0024A03C4C|nr:helix-turn-helix transcriptional regulator [Actinokineospora sp. NBRC 105648]GLZ39765.1 transcriptional regulator [Actinokineospora sp. NBRC 105648]